MNKFRWSRVSEQDYGGFLEVIELNGNKLTVSSGYGSEGVNDRKEYSVKFGKAKLPDLDDFIEDSIDSHSDQSEELSEFLNLDVIERPKNEQG